jgi:hypothetical protein
MTSKEEGMKISTDEMVGLIKNQCIISLSFCEKDAIIARLKESDRMEAWIKKTYGDWGADDPATRREYALSNRGLNSKEKTGI